jgi:dihydrofolate reductase
MRKLVAGTFVTLDGVMQGPGGPEEDRDGGFEHGGWSVKYWDGMMGKVVVEQTLQADALLLGRRTYEIFASYWPRVTDPNDPVATKLNGMPKYVASRTLRKVDWANSTLLQGDAATAVARLKKGTEGASGSFRSWWALASASSATGRSPGRSGLPMPRRRLPAW